MFRESDHVTFYNLNYPCLVIKVKLSDYLIVSIALYKKNDNFAKL